MKKNQNSNNNDKNKKTNDESIPSSARSESGSARSESGFYFTLPVSDDELDRSAYLPDVANIKGINIFESKNKTKIYFEYLKNNLNEFFNG